MIDLIGGPDRDRTDDLFHAMEVPRWRFVDGKGLTSRLSRQNRPTRRSMLPICYQLSIERARADMWGSARFSCLAPCRWDSPWPDALQPPSARRG